MIPDMLLVSFFSSRKYQSTHQSIMLPFISFLSSLLSQSSTVWKIHYFSLEYLSPSFSSQAGIRAAGSWRGCCCQVWEEPAKPHFWHSHIRSQSLRQINHWGQRGRANPGWHGRRWPNPLCWHLWSRVWRVFFTLEYSINFKRSY